MRRGMSRLPDPRKEGLRVCTLLARSLQMPTVVEHLFHKMFSQSFPSLSFSYPPPPTDVFNLHFPRPSNLHFLLLSFVFPSSFLPEICILLTAATTRQMLRRYTKAVRQLYHSSSSSFLQGLPKPSHSWGPTSEPKHRTFKSVE